MIDISRSVIALQWDRLSRHPYEKIRRDGEVEHKDHNRWEWTGGERSILYMILINTRTNIWRSSLNLGPHAWASQKNKHSQHHIETFYDDTKPIQCAPYHVWSETRGFEKSEMTKSCRWMQLSRHPTWFVPYLQIGWVHQLIEKCDVTLDLEPIKQILADQDCLGRHRPDTNYI